MVIDRFICLSSSDNGGANQVDKWKGQDQWNYLTQIDKLTLN